MVNTRQVLNQPKIWQGIVLSTWKNMLKNEKNLPENWLKSPRVLVGISKEKGRTVFWLYNFMHISLMFLLMCVLVCMLAFCSCGVPSIPPDSKGTAAVAATLHFSVQVVLKLQIIA